MKSQNKAFWYLVYGQSLLISFVLVCIAIKPHFFFESNQGGISNYGLYAATVVPFSLSTLCGAVLSWMSTAFIPSQAKLAKLIKVWSVLAVLTLLSTYPYKVNHAFDIIHQLFSVLLVFFEVGVGSFIALVVKKNYLSLSIWFIQLVTFALAILNYLGVIHKLMIIELLFGISFAFLVLYSVKQQKLIKG